MKDIVNHLIPFILPITVLVLVPQWIEPNIVVSSIPVLLLGSAFIGLEHLVMLLTLLSFIRIGKGILALWIPAKEFIEIR